MAISDFAIAMIVLVRPISVLLSTIGTEITKRERAIVAMMAPRGIVVLTVAQFFEDYSWMIM